MDDDASSLPADPAIAGSSSDPLVQFVPGEDMIAAHKRAMKAKESGGQWRGDKPLVSFFGGDSSIASMPQLESTKPRVFNSADYLLPSKAVEEERDEPEPASGSSAFQSRFQRFFGSGNPATEIPTSRSADRSPMEVLSPPSHPPSAPPDRPMPPPDDHLGKLMGLLKVSAHQATPLMTGVKPLPSRHPPASGILDWRWSTPNTTSAGPAILPRTSRVPFPASSAPRRPSSTILRHARPIRAAPSRSASYAYAVPAARRPAPSRIASPGRLSSVRSAASAYDARCTGLPARVYPSHAGPARLHSDDEPSLEPAGAS